MENKQYKPNMYEVYNNFRRGLNKFKWQLISTPFASSMTLIDRISFSDKKLDFKSIDIGDFFDEKVVNLFKSQLESELLILDLNESIGIDLAVYLNLNYKIKIIPVFAHIFHENARVGTIELLQKLIETSKIIDNDLNIEKYCLLLDYDRYNDEEYNRKKYFNNQYRLTEEELPSCEELNAYGVDKVSIISKSSLKEDIKEYIAYISDNGVQVKSIEI